MQPENAFSASTHIKTKAKNCLLLHDNVALHPQILIQILSQRAKTCIAKVRRRQPAARIQPVS